MPLKRRQCGWRLATPDEPKCPKLATGRVQSSPGAGWVPSCDEHSAKARIIGYAVVGYVKLSAPQAATLRSMAESTGGRSFVPGGYRKAGQDASRWWRTMECLARVGLVERERLGNGCYCITESGRLEVFGLEVVS